jgi:hypothetical protein
MSFAKYVQIRERDLFVIGGQDNHKHLVDYDYHVARSTWRVDTVTGTFKRLADMNFGRYGFALCSINNLIYVIGGANMKE